MERFKDKVIVISGGADGLGKAIAIRLAVEGAIPILFDNHKEKLADALRLFKNQNLKAWGLTVDVAEEDAVRNGFVEVTERYGKVDGMVNSAGIVGPTSTRITEYSTQAFDQIYAINLRGTFLMTKYALKSMEIHNYGRILLIASIAGKEGNPGMVGYSATKAGVIGLVKGVAKEYAHTGITINGLAPAVIKTAMNEATAPEQLAYMTAKIPMGRLGSVEEVAALSAFVLSDECSFTTGFVFDLSGGRATY